MNVYDREPRFKIGPVEVGNKLVGKADKDHRVVFRSGKNWWGQWVDEDAYVQDDNSVAYYKRIYALSDPTTVEEDELARVDKVLIMDEINRHTVVGRKLRWKP